MLGRLIERGVYLRLQLRGGGGLVGRGINREGA